MAKRGSRYVRKGILRGETHGRAKLSAAAVLAARAEYRWRDKTHGLTALAKKHQVGRETMRCALQGITWAHL